MLRGSLAFAFEIRPELLELQLVLLARLIRGDALALAALVRAREPLL